MSQRALCVAAAGALLALAVAGPCDNLHSYYANKIGASCPQWVSVYGTERQVSLWWDGSAPSRAAAALLLAALRHGLRYRGLRLRRIDSSLCDFIRHLPHNCEDDNGHYDDVTVVPSATQCPASDVCARGAERLRAVGAGAAPARLRLHVRLAASARHLPVCDRAVHWTFYENATAIRLCSFLTFDDDEFLRGRAVVFVSEELVAAARKLQAPTLHWLIKSLRSDLMPRHTLFDLLRTTDMSVLFLDYDIWTDVQNVQIVDPPSLSIFDPVCTLRFANAKVLNQVAPQLYDVIVGFEPTVSELREVLELEANRTDSNITEAACDWANSNKNRFESWFQSARKIESHYWIAVFMCKDDEDNEQYKRVAHRVINVTNNRLERIKLKLKFIENIDCTSEYDLKNKFSKYKYQLTWTEMIGALATGAGTKGATYEAADMETALVLYDTPMRGVVPGNSTRIVGGPLTDLILALRRLLDDCNWKRLAVLSEDSQLANEYTDKLLLDNVLAIHNITLKANVSLYEIDGYLRTLQAANARIFFVNTSYKKALLILCAALKLNMTLHTGHVWILREWREINYTCRGLCEQTMNHFTISYWWRGGTTDTKHLNSSDRMMRRALNELWKEGAAWPQLTAPLADGLILLINSFKAFVDRCERNLYDLHGDGATRLFWRSLNGHVYGVTQELHPTDYVYSNPLIFVDEWHGAVRRVKATWRVQEDNKHKHHVCPISSQHMFSDGTQSCRTTMSRQNKFTPHCHDIAWVMAIVTIVLGVLALYLARRLRENLFKRSGPQLLEPRQTAVALAEHLVDRTALEFRHELGFGRFGRVRLAILRAPNRPTVVVAAKSLREDVAPTEETEFLREACTLASLRHENVVRLIGVCTMDGPPLVLMEHAFFGDLLRYLRERRHLVEHVNDEIPEEAMHVSPHALTRLAREASSALAYLVQRRLVHRDLRASNCLVDARRSLKLADFGMAREMAGNDMTAEYTCRRRGFFPVLWMAPESLDRGVFSAATDVWALGILMLEMVTLGERPYGMWSPMYVMRYVIAGGRPSFPLDTSLKTRGLLLSCWRREGKQRPTAAEIAAYLGTNPLALSPALESAALPLDNPYVPKSKMKHEDHSIF